MRKILHLELTKNRGGIETFLIRISKKMLPSETIKFDFITREKEKLEYEDELTKLGCNVIHLPNRIKGLFALICIIKHNDYDFIHFHKNSLANALPIFWGLLFSKSKIIVHSHNTLPTVEGVFPKFLHQMNKVVISLNNNIIKVACSNLAGNWMFLEKSKFSVIHNGVEVKNYTFRSIERMKLRKKYGIDDSDILIGCVGRLVRQKNHSFLIDVLKELPVNYKLMILGQGNLKDELSKKIKNLKLSERVLLLGQKDDVSSYFNAFDIFALPSLYEGLPIVGIEAQASGLPIIMSSSITNEVNISGKVNFIDLNVGRWVKKIKVLNLKRDNDVKTEFSNAQYNLSDTVKSIENIYKL